MARVPSHGSAPHSRHQLQIQAVSYASDQPAAAQTSPQPPPWAPLTRQNSSQNSGGPYVFTGSLKGVRKDTDGTRMMWYMWTSLGRSRVPEVLAPRTWHASPSQHVDVFAKCKAL